MVMSSATDMPLEWTFWMWPLLVVLVGGIPVWYLTRMKRFRSQEKGGASLSAGQASAFFAALGLAAAALLIPMDILGMNYVFTVHMAQHLLLSLAAPPLLLIGLPVGFFCALSSHPACQRALHWLTRLFVAAALFNGNIWLWHAPGAHLSDDGAARTPPAGEPVIPRHRLALLVAPVQPAGGGGWSPSVGRQAGLPFLQ